MQETPYTFNNVDEFNCQPNRGTSSNPLLLVNHWLRAPGPPDPVEAAELLTKARDAWLAIGRPLEAARCDLLTAAVLRETDEATARTAAERSAADYERLGVPHIAANALAAA